MVLTELFRVIAQTEQTFTYQKIFDLSGLASLLDSMYISTSDLNSEYVDEFYTLITKFVKQPLYKDLNLNDEKDLKFLRTDRDFISQLKQKIIDIKKRLISKHYLILDYLADSKKGVSIPITAILDTTKIDKASLLFILDDFKKIKKIYDFNGRVVHTL